MPFACVAAFPSPAVATQDPLVATRALLHATAASLCAAGVPARDVLADVLAAYGYDVSTIELLVSGHVQ